MPDLDEIVAAIDAGEFDGDVDAIATACVNRLRAEAIEMVWRIRLDGDEWTKHSATLGELKWACQNATVMDPVIWRRRQAAMAELDPRGNPEHAVSLVVAHLHKAQGVSLADAVKRAEAITAAEHAEMVTEFEVVNPPKDDRISDPSTP